MAVSVYLMSDSINRILSHSARQLNKHARIIFGVKFKRI